MVERIKGPLPAGRMDGWVDGWEDTWMEGKAKIRVIKVNNTLVQYF